jgi:hypothetical protein
MRLLETNCSSGAIFVVKHGRSRRQKLKIRHDVHDDIDAAEPIAQRRRRRCTFNGCEIAATN